MSWRMWWRATPLVVRSRLRREWPSMAALALLFGVAGGTVLGALAGARRVETSYDRLLTDVDAFDLLAIGDPEQLDQLETSSAVETVRPLWGLSQPVLRTASGQYLGPDAQVPCQTGDHEVNLIVAPDGWRTAGRLPMQLHDGRAPRADALEIAVSRTTADRVDLRVGERIALLAANCDDDQPALLPAPIALEVTGIGAGPFDIDVPGVDFVLESVIATPALIDALAPVIGQLADVDRAVAVWLAEGTQISDAGPAIDEATVPGLTVEDRVDLVRAGLRPDATALRVLAALVAIVSVAVLGQLLARHLRQAETDGQILNALGSSRRDRWLHGVLHTALIGVVAAVIAVVVAIAISTRVPRGLGEAVEGAGGVWIDVPMLAIGGVAVLPVVVALALLPAWSATRPLAPAASRTESMAARFARRARFGPVTTMGVRAALEPGRGVTAAPVRQGIAALAIALGAVAGVQTFSAGLTHLRNEPRMLGWGWDAVTFAEQDLDAVKEQLAARPDVERVTAATWFPPTPGWQLSSGDARADVYTVSFDAGPDAITPVVTQGRAPAGPAEILVARPVADRLGVEIGDSVGLTITSIADVLAADLGADGGTSPASVQSAAPPGGTTTLEVVGIGVIVNDLESGAAMTVDGMSRIVTLSDEDRAGLEARLSAEQLAELRTLLGNAAFRPHALLVDVRGGRSKALEVLDGMGEGWIVPRRGQDLFDRLVFLDLSRASRVPDVLGGLFAVAFVGVLAYVVSTGVRARRHDLATMRALGLQRRQVHAAVGWQATATIVLAALIGVSLGVFVGRLAWRSYARSLHVVPEAVTPWWWLVAVLVAGVVVANVVALGPAWRAARRRPTEDLRAE
jgi:FtsX-like permease family